jgi:deoxyribonuclease-4
MTKRIGVHLGTAGGASNAAERAREIGVNTFQIFSTSPRMWTLLIQLHSGKDRVKSIDLTVCVVYYISRKVPFSARRQKVRGPFSRRIEAALVLSVGLISFR